MRPVDICESFINIASHSEISHCVLTCNDPRAIVYATAAQLYTQFALAKVLLKGSREHAARDRPAAPVTSLQPHNPTTLRPYDPTTLQPYDPLRPYNPTTLQPYNPTTPYDPTTLRPYNPTTLTPEHPTSLAPLKPNPIAAGAVRRRWRRR
eukprot:500951-Prorocentrum_minimum.AAC.1